MRYDRTVVAYHGCDQRVAERLLEGDRFAPSDNDYDWLGRGIYFWEFGVDRAMRFAHEQKRRGNVKRPAVIGALLQLGNCFDLMDTRFTDDLARGYAHWERSMMRKKVKLPVNAGSTPDMLLRRLDCAVINWYLELANQSAATYDTVRCGFVEGGPVFAGSGINRESHVQIAVRNPNCVLGVFRPMMETT